MDTSTKSAVSHSGISHALAPHALERLRLQSAHGHVIDRHLPMTQPDRVTPKPSRAQLTRDDWIRAATATLVENGIDAVRVDTLARQLDVTRGSFYWHFSHRAELLESVLNAWRDAATQQVIDRFERRRIEPRQQIRELLGLPFRGRSARRVAAIELAIRAWARRDPMTRRFVDEVDATRLNYISRCFAALGFSPSEARVRAFALYSYEIAESLMPNQGSEHDKTERRQYMERTLLGPEPLAAAPPASTSEA